MYEAIIVRFQVRHLTYITIESFSSPRSSSCLLGEISTQVCGAPKSVLFLYHIALFIYLKNNVYNCYLAAV